MSRAVFPVMGTVASIVVSRADDERLGTEAVRAALSVAQQDLEILDHRFSHYAPDSEISTWLGGGAVSPDAIADFDHVLRACGRLRDDSRGVFTITNPLTGSVDTAGYVKGFGLRRAAGTLQQHGVEGFVIGVGGDTYCSGRADAGRPWRVAVSDPTRRRSVAAVVEATDLAVATSGTSERGDHIWSGRGAATAGLASFTVIGPDIAEADAYATIGFAMGEAGIPWVAAHAGYRSVAIRTDGRILSDAALVSAA